MTDNEVLLDSDIIEELNCYVDQIIEYFRGTNNDDIDEAQDLLMQISEGIQVMLDDRNKNT